MQRREFIQGAAALAAYWSLMSWKKAEALCYWEKDHLPGGVASKPASVGSLAQDDPRRRQNQFIPPTTPDANAFRFGSDGTFTFFQVTDYHRDSLRYKKGSAKLARERAFFLKACEKYAPALIVMTGDNVNLRCKDLFEDSAEPLVSLFTEARTPFALTFGNHDTELIGPGWYTAAEQWRIFGEIGGRLFVDRHDASVIGAGVQAIDVTTTSGEAKFRLAVIDSGDYGPQHWDGVRTPSVAWARKTLKEGLPTLFFQHIIVPESREKYGLGLFRDAKPGEKGVSTDYWGGTYVVNEARAVGELNEGMSSPNAGAQRLPLYRSEGESIYDVWQKAPNFRGAYFGHDHLNSFDGTTRDGVRLGVTKTAGLNCYNGGKAALRVFRLHADGTYETFIELEA